jgi:chorismate mutase
MPADSVSLDKVRREIDAIDDALHDALMRRASLIVEVSRAKENGAGSAMRPGREAQILRRIASRHDSDLPLEVVFRIWRELINAATAMQGPIAVAVCAPEKSAGYWDLARNHFGASTPMTLHVAPSVVMRHVVETPGMLGILPEPQDEEETPWWPLLASEARGGDVPRIVWRLPFFASPSGRFEELGALVISCMDPERSGQDVTVAAFDCDLDVSRGRLLEALDGIGLPGRVVATREGEVARGRLHLVLIDDFVAEDDHRLARLATVMDETLYRAVVLGSYPEPIHASGATTPADA